jgi:hypothetical protein
MVTWKLVGWLRAGLMSTLALAPFASADVARDNEPRPIGELSIDVDGDGCADTVRWARHEDAVWLDVTLAVAAPDRFAPRSTTRIAPAAAGVSVSAADLDGDGRMDVLVRDRGGHTTAWISDGLAFEARGASERSSLSSSQ